MTSRTTVSDGLGTEYPIPQYLGERLDLLEEVVEMVDNLPYPLDRRFQGCPDLAFEVCTAIVLATRQEAPQAPPDG